MKLIKIAKNRTNGTVVSDQGRSNLNGKNGNAGHHGNSAPTPEEKKSAKRKALTLEAFEIAYESNQKNRR